MIKEDQPDKDDIVYRLEERARIRRQIPSRKSVQEGKSDRIADLLEEAAKEIKSQRATVLVLGRSIRDFIGLPNDQI